MVGARAPTAGRGECGKPARRQPQKRAGGRILSIMRAVRPASDQEHQKFTSTRAPKYRNESRASPQLEPNAVTPGALNPAVPLPIVVA